MGTFTIISALKNPPNYQSATHERNDSSCQFSYDAFNFSNAPYLEALKLGPISSNPDETLITFYSGNPKKYLNILSFTVKQISTGDPLTNVGKLFYNGTEVTSFPFTPIDISAKAPTDQTGFVIGRQLHALCRDINDGYKIELLFSVTDSLNVTGPVRLYTSQTKYVV